MHGKMYVLNDEIKSEFPVGLKLVDPEMLQCIELLLVVCHVNGGDNKILDIGVNDKKKCLCIQLPLLRLMFPRCCEILSDNFCLVLPTYCFLHLGTEQAMR